MASQRNSVRAATMAALAVLGTTVPGWFARHPANADAPATQTERLELKTGSGNFVVNVEIADTPAKQAVGLMYRTALADTHGMLFVHDGPREVTMWMRNTYIPLDMVFIRADGTVHRIAERTEPMSEAIVASNGPVLAVLEIPGGAASRFGLKPGDRVLHRAFMQK